MSRISGISIPAKVSTKGVSEGIKDTERQLNAFKSKVNRSAEALAPLGGGRLAGGLRAAGGLSTLTGISGNGAGRALVGAGLTAAGIAGIISVLERIAETQIKARDLLASGTGAAGLMRQGINPVLAGRLAQNAPGTSAGMGDAFMQAAGSRGGMSAGSMLRYAGGFAGDVFGQMTRGRIPAMPGTFFRQTLGKNRLVDWGQAHDVGAILSSDTAHEALLRARDSAYTREMLRATERSIAASAKK